MSRLTTLEELRLAALRAKGYTASQAVELAEATENAIGEINTTIASINSRVAALESRIESIADGKSAYEIACENGFSGSEVQWLQSLKGADGEKGEQGLQGDTYQLTDSDRADIAAQAVASIMAAYPVFDEVGV